MVMDPCPFVRLIVESLALKLPPVARLAGPGVHPSATPCFCSIQLQDFPSLTAPLPLAFDLTWSTNLIDRTAASASSPPVVINLHPAALEKMSGRSTILTVAVYTGRSGKYSCGIASGRRLLGRVRAAVPLETAAVQATVVQNGWVSMGSGQGAARLHLLVRTEPDPRFVFQFGGEPECSPVVYQIHGGGGRRHSGSVRQPVFSCRFSADRRRTDRSSSLQTEIGVQRYCFGSFAGEGKSEKCQQRKGWTVTIHDLSGFPVAAASVVTPFVPSPGSDRVSRSHPGAWLILRAVGPSAANWKPWGRLEVWLERVPLDALGYNFELVPDAGTTHSSSRISLRRGGELRIDAGGSSGGFVMAAAVEGRGKVSRPTVQVGAQHVACMADAALFIALSAAVDLSLDACQPFSQKLRRELCPREQDYVAL